MPAGCARFAAGLRPPPAGPGDRPEPCGWWRSRRPTPSTPSRPRWPPASAISARTRSRRRCRRSPQAADTTIRWHLIGHLQSNKARKAGEAFDWIHAIDSVELLQQRRRRRRPQPDGVPELLVQVDLARRGHQARRAAGRGAGHFRRRAERCTAAELVGLMLLPPAGRRPGGRAAVVPPAARAARRAGRRRAFRRHGWPSCRWA